MNENETTALVSVFDRAYINGKFVTPHGTKVVDLVNPTDNTVIGKVTMADEIDTRQAIAAGHRRGQGGVPYLFAKQQGIPDGLLAAAA
jgi:acyl-CoA reductase-like NAD-dependent aldehyde dehydrogenase